MSEEGLSDLRCTGHSQQSTLLTMWTHYEGPRDASFP